MKPTKTPGAPTEKAPQPDALQTTNPRGQKIWVTTVYGPMTNLHNNEVFTREPKRTIADDFILAQLEAGKMLPFTD